MSSRSIFSHGITNLKFGTLEHAIRTPRLTPKTIFQAMSALSSQPSQRQTFVKASTACLIFAVAVSACCCVWALA